MPPGHAGKPSPYLFTEENGTAKYIFLIFVLDCEAQAVSIDRNVPPCNLELKGGRLEAVVRFLVWGGDPAVADA